MSHYFTALETDVRFIHRSYPAGTYVRVMSALVDDGVALVRFPEGEETYLAAWRMTTPPERAA